MSKRILSVCNVSKVSAVASILAVSIALSGCGAVDKSASQMPASPQAAAMDSIEFATNDGGVRRDLGEIAPMVTDRKIVKRTSFTLQTMDYTKSVDDITKKIDEVKGFIETSNYNGDVNDGDASAHLTVRIPVDSIEAFNEVVVNSGNVTSRSENGEDVTAQYFDTDARLTSLTAQEKRVLELLDKAETIEDIISIESELARIRLEIEQLTTVIKRYDDLVTYATVNVNIIQSKEYIVKNESVLAKLGNLVKASFDGFVTILGGIGVALVWLLPYAMVVGIASPFAIPAIKKYRAKRKGKSKKSGKSESSVSPVIKEE